VSKVEIPRIYEPLFDQSHNKRYIIVTGGRGSGKSFAVTTAICADVWTYPNKRVLYSRYTMTAAEISILPEFIEKIELLGGSRHFDIRQRDIEHKTTGSDILFRGIKTSSGNQTAKLKSIQGITTFVLDEAEEMDSEKDFDTIDLSIRQQGVRNSIVLIMNPTTKEHWIYKRWFEGHIKYIDINGFQIPVTTHPEVIHIHTTYLNTLDNLDQSFIDQLEKLQTTNPDKYKNIVLGGWLEKAEGVIFEDWQEGTFDNSLPYAYGLDFGYFPDPTALIKVAVDNAKKRVYLDEKLYSDQLSTEQIISAVRAAIRNHRDMIIADSAEPRTIQDMAKARINVQPAQKGPDSVRAGIMKMQGYTLVVTHESHNLKKELNNYVWNDRKSSTPIDDYNHLIDAARYCFTRLVLGKGKGVRRAN